MPKTTNHDFLLLFYCIIAGVLLCALCDIFRTLRKASKREAVLTFILDFLFLITVSLTTFFMQFIYSNGRLRWYIAVGELVGFISARICISPWLMKLLDKITALIRLLLKPIKAIVLKCGGQIMRFLTFAQKNIIKICKNVLKWTGSLLYNVKDKSQKRNFAFFSKSNKTGSDKNHGAKSKRGKRKAKKA